MINFITAEYAIGRHMVPPKEPQSKVSFGNAPNPNRIADIPLPKPKKDPKDIATPPVPEKKGTVARILDFFA